MDLDMDEEAVRQPWASQEDAQLVLAESPEEEPAESPEEELAEDNDREEEPVVDHGRRELEEDSSEYEPSDSSSSESEPEPKPQTRVVPPAIPAVQAGWGANQLKRPHSGEEATEGSGTNRNKNTAKVIQPPKRIRTAEPAITAEQLAAYRRLLQVDNADAARQYVPDAWPPLAASQAGLVVWSADEKAMLYESVARLGRDDLPQLAARVQTKDAVEIHHYLHLVDQAADAAAAVFPDEETMALADIPAASEISAVCCAALEKAADAVARHDEIDEDRAEERHWGAHWVLTKQNARYLTHAARTDGRRETPSAASATSASPPPAPPLHPEAVPLLLLFRVPSLLLLAERFFMNGPPATKPDGCGSDDANWRSVQQQRVLPVWRAGRDRRQARERFHGAAPPALRMAALADLHALVRTVTQRLVAAALHVSRSRMRARRTSQPRLRANVRPSDVAAAAASLGLARNSAAFWAKCPRRLRLRVYDDQEEDNGDDGEANEDDQDNDSEADEDDSSEEESDSSRDDDDDDDSSDDENENSSKNLFLSYDQVEALLMPAPTSRSSGPAVFSPVDSTEDGDASSSETSDGSESSSSASEDEDTSDNSDSSDDDDDDSISRKYTPSKDTSTVNNDDDDDDDHATAAANTADRHASSLEEIYLWDVLGQVPRPAHQAALEADADAALQPVPALAEKGAVVEDKDDGDDLLLDHQPDWRVALEQHYRGEWETVAAAAAVSGSDGRA